MKEYTFYIAMVVVQLAYGGSNILIKISLDKGLSQLVFVVYRHLIAMLLLGPFAYVLERKQRPSLSFSIITKIFVLSSLGTTIHLNVYYAGLAYTSPTVASALSNVSPSLTFIIALLLRMEKVKIASMRSQAKVLGTVICICGSLVFTFWKGGHLLKGFVEKPLINIHAGSVGDFKHSKQNWIKGSALILISHIAWSGWLILQAVVTKVYPARLSLTTMICFFAALQSCLLALFFDRKPTSWKLEWDVNLLTIVYSGVVLSALVYYLQTWCISNKGPVFAAMFSPLLLIFVGIFSAIAFAERLHFGSLIGAFLIVAGLYFVLWGKRADNNFVVGQSDQIGKHQSDDSKVLEISPRMSQC
ncbi:WAT1-related protein At5g07050 [Ziziphus jujuba]|uniref:WAT1-related protein n=1 Tax=Ziziphus jujuba TaxID=326968 RepID=A0ABM3I3Z0_ZIZJJ|nr:WAT1-related protein At5g07050 [Ziziphus jujuba]